MRNLLVSQVVCRAFVCIVLIAGLCCSLPVQAQRRKGGRNSSVSRARGQSRVPPCDGTKESLETSFVGERYTGKLIYPKEGMNGEATLEVTGSATNQRFTLTYTATGKTLSGSLPASTSCKYTGVTIYFDDLSTRDTNDPPPARHAISLRACNEKPGIILRSKVPDEFYFEAPGRPNTPELWGRCYGSGRTSGNRPL